MKPPAIYLACPVCGETLAVELAVTVTGTKGGPTTATIEVTPDLADVWAHAWTHDPPA